MTAGAVRLQLSIFMPLTLGIGHVRNFIFTPRLHPSFVYPVSILVFWLWFYSAKLNGDNLELEKDCRIIVLKSLWLGTDCLKILGISLSAV